MVHVFYISASKDGLVKLLPSKIVSGLAMWSKIDANSINSLIYMLTLIDIYVTWRQYNKIWFKNAFFIFEIVVNSNVKVFEQIYYSKHNSTYSWYQEL